MLYIKKILYIKILNRQSFHTRAQTQPLVTCEVHMIKSMTLRFLPGPLHGFIVWVLHWEIQERHTSARLSHTHLLFLQTVGWSNTSPNTKRNSIYFNKWCSVVINNLWMFSQTSYSGDKIGVNEDSSHLPAEAQKWTPLSSSFPVSLTLPKSHHIRSTAHSQGLHLHLSNPPTHHCLLCCLTAPSLPCLVPDLLKSVPVSWARMRKERDWVVPVRGCQSSVSWISLFLLRSLGIKQGRFSTLRPCLHTHPAAHGRRRLTQPHPGTTHSHQPSYSGDLENRGHPEQIMQRFTLCSMVMQ